MSEPNDDDSRLVAFLDGQLDEGETERMRRRLADDPALRQRLEELRQAEPRVRAAFDLLLGDAPIGRLRARLDATSAPRIARAWPRRAAAAAVAAALIFAGGFGAARYFEPSEDWRQAVAEYMTLYTPETFGGAATATLRHDLEAMSERLGVPLDPEKLSVAGLSPRRAEALQYEGAPLGQIGYLEGKIPVAFCVFRDGESDAPLTIASRSGFATASWAKGGRGFMLIGDLPADRIEALARVLQERIS